MTGTTVTNPCGRPLQLKETQCIAIEVLDELDRFCRSSGIKYYLIGGSLVGAVRSQDLVPWDDDIDVAMRRDDYERFCSTYMDNEKYSLLTYRRGENYRHGMAKLVDSRTIFVEPTSSDDTYGVFVDIFPLDKVESPNDPIVAKLARRTKAYNYAFVIGPEATKGSKTKDAMRVILAHTVGLGSYRKSLERIEASMKSGEGDYLINHWGAWGKKECVPLSCFEEEVLVTLRGKQYSAPVGYDQWLTSVYGGYMSPPKNPPHYHGRAYLKEGAVL